MFLPPAPDGQQGNRPKTTQLTANLLQVVQATRLVLDTVEPLGTEEVPVERALGRVLTAPVRAAGDVPRFPNSAMDGFAVTAGPAGRRLRIVGESRAGHPAGETVADGTAVRISTGAAMPAGADGVVPVEEARDDGDHVTVEAPVAPGRHVRLPGEDLRAGAVVLEAGIRLAPAELGVAVSAGAATVTCGRRPRVTVLSTGDELRPPGAELGPGEIHNSNAVALAGLATVAGAEVLGAERVSDAREATRAALSAALERSDVLLLSGGVSVGPHDHVRPALAELGVEERFWGVQLQPGKPTWFGRRDARLVFGLPGNPVSALVTYTLFARPALLALQGGTDDAARGEAELAVPVRRHNREQALRVRLERRDGRLLATPNGPQGSHVLSSMVGADALAMLPPGDGEAPAGFVVPLIAL
ncbi:MAG: molybdenum cofactor synthesis domain protein [Solirubrobacterales bacterium]|nr:molybdenum cofactor synthesis domain protein [Solirubrobacterales bacterium]